MSRKITRILCAVDIATHGKDDPVLETAARQAQWEGAALEVLTVVPDMGVGEVTSFFPPDYEKKAVGIARDRLHAHVARVLGEERAREVACVVAAGSVYREVLRVAAVSGADLIVVGSHKPKAADFLLGSNAARIVRHAACSVYVVR
ncbi:Nucleotide-binding universal stress protein, UspA family [Meinhardsimonia xiamenensis]|jgi:nucleotide-binding universal stress UspA family protein|uniref:Nucleotide-binding universal stress protein, UspA family n=1 Tax=Meinhardsimonia xiamenensis TaxID=990712 RepID=A0A1G9ANN1_9RHOB|nr:universal stress protein [Meinhardsimonia xiamenensis]PRX35308.1 nucleotide-binding universal stress UspA family protein [Meinhardsimonia xiamenensis]SDK28843.1 Nucleotide-binding universal stress protein, UspA family [Meinhardsimonia xiamenensis]